jgi:thiamine biosynthesis lipoprotein
LATGIFVLGVEVGLDLVNQLKGIECIIVDDKGKIHSSKGIDIKKYN